MATAANFFPCLGDGIVAAGVAFFFPSAGAISSDPVAEADLDKSSAAFSQAAREFRHLGTSNISVCALAAHLEIRHRMDRTLNSANRFL